MTARLKNKLPGIYCVICGRRAGGKKSRMDSPTGQPPFNVWVHTETCIYAWKNLNLCIRYGVGPEKMQKYLSESIGEIDNSKEKRIPINQVVEIFGQYPAIDTGRRSIMSSEMQEFQSISRLFRENFKLTELKFLVDFDYSEIEPRIVNMDKINHMIENYAKSEQEDDCSTCKKQGNPKPNFWTNFWNKIKGNKDA